MPGTELPSIGEVPPVGEVPKRMRPQVIRPDGFGDPRSAFEETPAAHDDMERGVDVFGNRVALVGAAEPGLGRQ